MPFPKNSEKLNSCFPDVSERVTTTRMAAYPKRRKKFPLSHLVIARILVQQSGENGARSEVSDDGVGIVRAKTFGIANQALMISGVGVVHLPNAGLEAMNTTSTGSKHPSATDLEFLLGRKRR